MKKYPLILTTILLLNSPLFSQQIVRNVNGTWINTNVANYYKIENRYNNNDKYFFDNDRCIPLYLSFKDSKELELVERYAQPHFRYTAEYCNGNIRDIRNAKNVYPLIFNDSILTLSYHNRKIDFIKVSDKYSKDAFGLFIENMLFRNHEKYISENIRVRDTISSNNFLKLMARLFKCKIVAFTELGAFTYENKQLPELSLYGVNNRLVGTVAMLIGKDKIEFIDENKKKKVLTLLRYNIK